VQQVEKYDRPCSKHESKRGAGEKKNRQPRELPDSIRGFLAASAEVVSTADAERGFVVTECQRQSGRKLFV
jgi:hypothetical protein